MTRKATELTTWDVCSYDVWGNEKDGYEVNDSFLNHRDYEIACPITINNAGTEHEFKSAYPTHKQIREALSIKPRVRLELDGDDLLIEVRHASSGYPLGALRCTSHESLSAIRKA